MFENYLAKSQMGNTCFCDPALKCHEKNQVSGGAIDRGEGRHSNKGKQIASGQESGPGLNRLSSNASSNIYQLIT